MKRIGLSLLVLTLALTVTPCKSQTNFTVLKTFFGTSDGANPNGNLVVGKDGDLYGTTSAGGVSNAGTVFKIKKNGWGFRTLNGSLGAPSQGPFAGVVVDQEGNLYGTTYGGGTSNVGTIFKLSSDGSTLTILYSFTGTTDGLNPATALILGSDAVLYGTTYHNITSNKGTVFRIKRDGTDFSVLHTFTGTAGSSWPQKLMEGSDGRLYGTVRVGGTNQGGIAFALQKDGTDYTLLHSFPEFLGDGSQPISGLLEGSDGALYGTTDFGGGSAHYGTVFRLTKDLSRYSILHAFAAVGEDGNFPKGELFEGPDGALYGVTSGGGGVPGGSGIIYRLNKDGTGYEILLSFSGLNGNGAGPYAGLVSLNGNVFFGTTYYGVTGNDGMVYALSTLPLPPLGLSISVSASSNLVQFAATSGIQYDVLRSTDLSSWSTLGTVTSPNNGQINFPDLNPPQPAGFYRLRQH